jgi:Tfp pilus assembly protein PilF
VKTRLAWAVVVVGCVCLVVAGAVAGDPPSEREPGDPIFIRWLEPEDPQDQTILDYWRRFDAGELSPTEIVDLGTMLFHRGYPKDAVRCYRAALKLDSGLYDAWFRIGMVKHHSYEIDDARYAYRKCLKLLTGHGWCNFYLGLLEEQTGHPSKALDYYRRAFKFAPELADPEYNTALLYSKLQLGASMQRIDQGRFVASAPIDYLDPDQVAEVRSRFEPTPTVVIPSPEDAVVATPAAPSAAAEGAVRPPSTAPASTPTPVRTQVVVPEDTAFGIAGSGRRPRTVQPPMPTGTPEAVND